MNTEPWIAVYAANPAQTRGRLFATEGSPTRSEFQRDRDRVIHSTAFRRLKHKTQVFVYHEGDHYRTRLTHSLEVAQIARSIARALGLNEDLAEALALAHDLGHTPFGHSGEDALNACMIEAGGFDHNAQALRIVTQLEHRYAEFDGLNLTWETLEGLVKHNGALINTEGRPIGRYKNSKVPGPILDYTVIHDLCLWSQASAEAQVAALADDIAYNAHDIDDGLRAELFTLDQLEDVPFLAQFLHDIRERYPTLERSRIIHELMRRVITTFVEDVIGESLRGLRVASPQSCDDIRRLPESIIRFSEPMERAEQTVKAFLYLNMYRHPRVMRVREKAEGVVTKLFEAFINDPEKLPEEWRLRVKGLTPLKQTRHIGDYIAGMTDRFALLEHQRLFGEAPTLRETES
jgi:dGTPase